MSPSRITRSHSGAIRVLALVAALALFAAPAVRAQEAAPDPAAPAAPSLARLQARTHERRLRLTLAGGRYELQRGELTPGGVAFAPGDLYRSESPVNGEYGRQLPPPPPAPPVAWARLARIEAHRSNASGGFLVGTLLGAAVGTALTIGYGDPNDDMYGLLAMVAIGGSTSAGLVLGTAIGAGAGHWTTEWRAPGAPRSRP